MSSEPFDFFNFSNVGEGDDVDVDVDFDEDVNFSDMEIYIDDVMDLDATTGDGNSGRGAGNDNNDGKRNDNGNGNGNGNVKRNGNRVQAMSSMTTPLLDDDDIDDAMNDAMNDPDLMTKRMAKELYEMKPEDREAANNELHGVEFTNNAASGRGIGDVRNHNNLCSTVTTEESPERRVLALNAMQEFLDELVPPSPLSMSPSPSQAKSNNGKRNYQAYRRGLELKSEYICTPEFRLKFLRADRFDARKAALRYCNCLDFLVELFGEMVLHRQLYMSDLTYEDLKCMREGSVQVLPSRDRIGRRILVFVGKPSFDSDEELHAVQKYFIYLLWTVLAEDVTTQCKGAVVLVFPRLDAMGKGDAKNMKRAFDDIPLRYSAIHFCIPNEPIFNAVRAFSLIAIGVEGRRVARIHTGSLIEVDYALSSYGIIIKDIPRTYTWMIKTKNLTRFAKARQAIDSFRKKAAEAAAAGGVTTHSMSERGGVECPEANCILFGNKAMSWDHPGNIEFRDIIEEKELERERESQSKSFSLKGDRYNDSIIEEGRSQNFRFLEYDKRHAWYVEITDNGVLRHKITQLLTGIRKRRKSARLAQKMRIDAARSESPSVNIGLDGARYQTGRCEFLCK